MSERCRVCLSYGYCYVPDRCPKHDEGSGPMNENERPSCGDPQCPDWHDGHHFHDPWPSTTYPSREGESDE